MYKKEKAGREGEKETGRGNWRKREGETEGKWKRKGEERRKRGKKEAKRGEGERGNGKELFSIRFPDF